MTNSASIFAFPHAKMNSTIVRVCAQYYAIAFSVLLSAESLPTAHPTELLKAMIYVLHPAPYSPRDSHSSIPGPDR
jgi:hypothetical protein